MANVFFLVRLEFKSISRMRVAKITQALRFQWIWGHEVWLYIETFALFPVKILRSIFCERKWLNCYDRATVSCVRAKVKILKILYFICKSNSSDRRVERDFAWFTDIRRRKLSIKMFEELLWAVFQLTGDWSGERIVWSRDGECYCLLNDVTPPLTVILLMWISVQCHQHYWLQLIFSFSSMLAWWGPSHWSVSTLRETTFSSGQFLSALLSPVLTSSL